MNSKVYKRVIFCKCMRICETKQGTMENELFEWLCPTQKNITAVCAQTMTVNPYPANVENMVSL